MAEVSRNSASKVARSCSLGDSNSGVKDVDMGLLQAGRKIVGRRTIGNQGRDGAERQRIDKRAVAELGVVGQDHAAQAVFGEFPAQQRLGFLVVHKAKFQVDGADAHEGNVVVELSDEFQGVGTDQRVVVAAYIAGHHQYLVGALL